MKRPFLSYQIDQNRTMLIATGDWTMENVAHIEQVWQTIPYKQTITWDVSGITTFDSAGMLLFIDYFQALQKKVKVQVVGYTKKQEDMFKLLNKTYEETMTPTKQNTLESIGKKTYRVYQEIESFISFIGTLFYTIYHTIISPKNFRFKEVVYHIHHSGFNAIVIIGLTAFLVGMVISYQGSVQLAKFGADLFIVDTVALSITRELGPMITAIVIAGRSGSAYTAEIGAMKITEEIAAMRTMGFDPYAFLVLPRIVALMIALPLLIFFADIVGILGGLVASKMQLGISPSLFIDRLYNVLEVKHYLLGMLKGPVFAFLIASVGCFRGLSVSDNTESVGLQTTASVVNSIFLVIAFDALFSVIYTELGL